LERFYGTRDCSTCRIVGDPLHFYATLHH